jgi:hypothetical protein
MARGAFTLLLPLGIALAALSFRFPGATERLYARGIYPYVVQLFGALNRSQISIAEIAAGIGAAAILAATGRLLLARRWRALARASWAGAGIVLWAFLLLWGFNYGRPPLEARMNLDAGGASPADLLDAGKRAAARTTTLFEELGAEVSPTRLPVDFAELDALVDQGYRRLSLPGDTIDGNTTPAKALRSSLLFAYLGISGIFVPFTGEPSVNALQPDVALPFVLAHEKAHQRGVTHEGEANFAAFLVCSRATDPYLRYSAYLFATSFLLREASLHLPREDVLEAWELLGPGPRADLRAVQEFWQRYEGLASEAASHVNDGYLRALRVPEGVASYDTVARMLLALDRRGEL